MESEISEENKFITRAAMDIIIYRDGEQFQFNYLEMPISFASLFHYYAKKIYKNLVERKNYLDFKFIYFLLERKTLIFLFDFKD